AYDEQKIASAARFCFMLRLIGHEKNFILDGGIKRWVDKGYPLEKGRGKKDLRYKAEGLFINFLFLFY
ncbi:MAG: sulfurtransferase, partial [Thermovenabulum sp.]